jgi:hypothetical protein
MSVRDHKSAHEIARAVDMHMKRSSARSQYGHQLIGVYKDAKRTGSIARTGPQDLKDIRTSLCVECRGDALTSVTSMKAGRTTASSFGRANSESENWSGQACKSAPK